MQCPGVKPPAKKVDLMTYALEYKIPWHYCLVPYKFEKLESWYLRAPVFLHYVNDSWQAVQMPVCLILNSMSCFIEGKERADGQKKSWHESKISKSRHELFATLNFINGSAHF